MSIAKPGSPHETQVHAGVIHTSTLCAAACSWPVPGSAVRSRGTTAMKRPAPYRAAYQQLCEIIDNGGTVLQLRRLHPLQEFSPQVLRKLCTCRTWLLRAFFVASNDALHTSCTLASPISSWHENASVSKVTSPCCGKHSRLARMGESGASSRPWMLFCSCASATSRASTIGPDALLRYGFPGAGGS